jgi:hypothetical protein
MASWSLLVIVGTSMRLLRRTELSSDTSPGCIGVKDGKIHTITLAFSQEELQGAEIIDAE